MLAFEAVFRSSPLLYADVSPLPLLPQTIAPPTIAPPTTCSTTRLHALRPSAFSAQTRIRYSSPLRSLASASEHVCTLATSRHTAFDPPLSASNSTTYADTSNPFP